MTERIPFTTPHFTGREFEYIRQAFETAELSGDGAFTRKCHEWIEANTGTRRALLTHSCTAALEMTALLLEIEPGDEIIMPSYTFVSTANAFVLRGAFPVFVDIRPDTLNLNEALIEDAVTPKTRAIVPVHYAGVACEMDSVLATANKHGLAVVEDAAQGVGASYKGRALGSIGDFGAFSFHQTKNLVSGEGGALLVNNPAFIQRAEIIREKGTDRSRFFRGEVDKYTWREAGSSYLPSELIAAFLYAQLEHADTINGERLQIWNRYHDLAQPLEAMGLLRRPVIPNTSQHNGHMYYVLVDPAKRAKVLDRFREHGIGAVFHYVPLHSSPAGIRYGRVHADLAVTDSASQELIRLPLWFGMTVSQQERIIALLSNALQYL